MSFLLLIIFSKSFLLLTPKCMLLLPLFLSLPSFYVPVSFLKKTGLSIKPPLPHLFAQHCLPQKFHPVGDAHRGLGTAGCWEKTVCINRNSI